MQFGERIRELRRAKDWTQQTLAEHLSISPSYISKIEKPGLHAGDYPNEKFIHLLAEALEADEDELMVLTDRVPNMIRKRVLERPEAFRRLASLDDRSLNRIITMLDAEPSNSD